MGKTHASSVRQDFTYGTPPRFAKREKMAMLRIKSMYEHNLYSLRYLCTFSYSKNNSKFTGSLLKIYVCDVNKTLPSMKVKYVYVIQNSKYSGKKSMEHRLGHTLSVLSLYQRYFSVV